MMNTNDFNQKDNFTQEDFKLVQVDAKIHDLKFETKPTTFFKDAMRRFAKNKSSVVGAIILGILVLLSIFVPVISTHNIKTINTDERFLAPKLFKTGTGFWDGTRTYTNIVYDTVNKVPADYNPDAVYKVIGTREEKINVANKYGVGGYVILESDSNKREEYFLSSSTITFTSDDFQFDTTLSNVDGALDGELAEYCIVLKDKENEIILKDWSKEYGEFTIDISKALQEKGLDTFTGTLTFKTRRSANGDSNKKFYILIEKGVFSSSESFANDCSFVDATTMVCQAPRLSNDQSVNPMFWTSNGRKGIYQSTITYCDFVYDTYAKAYGEEVVTYSKSQLDKFVKNKWITYSYSNGKIDYKILDEDKCPFQSIDSCQENPITKELLSVKASCEKWKDLGYKKMPKFIFGTDEYGHDIFKKAFAGLRTSLILGICTTAFCFLFGLCWGSISGYFGGNVDLAMERFCEILSGVPWIVVMTLCILHLGNNFLTFFFALCLTGWMGTAARTRTQFYRFKGREYILASRTLGSSDARLIFRHILPNSLGTIITSSVLMIPSIIFSEATLAYLNLGLQGVESFGVMMAHNQQYIDKYPNLVVFPAVIIALMMISFNLFGNGLRDAFNPSLKGSE